MKLLTTLFGLALFAAVSAGQEPKKEPAPPTDAERLQGTWVVESVRVNGRDEAAGNHPWVGEEFVFEENRFRFAFFPGRQGTFQLKNDATPKQIDFQLPKIKTEDRKSPGFLRGIHKFDGDQLRLSLGVANEEDRPEDFDQTETGPPFLHVKLRRPGPAAKPPALSGPALRLRTLREERAKALRAAADLSVNRYEIGQLRLPEVIALEENLYSAERELAATADERLTALDSRVRRLKEHEKQLEALASDGKVPTQDHALMKAARLAAQIDRELFLAGK